MKDGSWEKIVVEDTQLVALIIYTETVSRPTNEPISLRVFSREEMEKDLIKINCILMEKG